VRDGRRILVVVPARGGSKGVALKNLRPVQGAPLVALVGDCVRALPWVDRVVVSTDHAEIAKTAREAGLDVPFFRPPELSGDRVGDLEVLTHALEATEADDSAHYDVVVMLQPTSPLRRPEHVTACVDRVIGEGFDAAWTVSPSDPKAHPLKQLQVVDDGELRLWDPKGATIVARQELVPLVHRNGAAYAFTRACLLEQGTILGRRTGAVVIEEPMVSIDTLEDFRRVEQALEARGEPASPVAATPAQPPTRDGSRTFVVDIDGVIASLVPENDYNLARPLEENIGRVNSLHARGHRIVLFTARGSATGRDWTDLTRSQLGAWGVRYHELRFGKPAADYYIDDRLVTLDDAVAITGAEPEKPRSRDS
jgi:CMP-N,N'-diacetyllegionaminic acid synthase